MKKFYLFLMATLMSTMSFAQGKTLVTPPANAEVETWDIAGGTFMVGMETTWEDYTQLAGGAMNICFDGQDVYIQGLATAYMYTAWIKGTINGNKVIFPSGQYVGTDKDGDEYINGQDVNAQTQNDPAIPIVFNYDAEIGKLSLDDQVIILENGLPNSIAATFAYWEGLVLTKPAPIPDPVTPPAGIEAKEWTVMGCPVKLVTNEKTGQQEPEFGEAEQFPVKVVRDGNNYYIQGLCYFAQDSWVKGTREGDNVIFQTGQNFGIWHYTDDKEESYDYQLFQVGFGTNGICDLVFKVNAEGTILNNENAFWQVTSMSPKSLVYHLEIYLIATITDKAYLEAGVKGIRENTQEPDAFYNLQGQKVENAKKGLYIKNGRKVFVR